MGAAAPPRPSPPPPPPLPPQQPSPPSSSQPPGKEPAAPTTTEASATPAAAAHHNHHPLSHLLLLLALLLLSATLLLHARSGVAGDDDNNGRSTFFFFSSRSGNSNNNNGGGGGIVVEGTVYSSSSSAATSGLSVVPLDVALASAQQAAAARGGGGDDDDADPPASPLSGSHVRDHILVEAGPDVEESEEDAGDDDASSAAAHRRLAAPLASAASGLGDPTRVAKAAPTERVLDLRLRVDTSDTQAYPHLTPGSAPLADVCALNAPCRTIRLLLANPAEAPHLAARSGGSYKVVASATSPACAGVRCEAGRVCVADSAGVGVCREESAAAAAPTFEVAAGTGTAEGGTRGEPAAFHLTGVVVARKLASGGYDGGVAGAAAQRVTLLVSVVYTEESTSATVRGAVAEVALWLGMQPVRLEAAAAGGVHAQVTMMLAAPPAGSPATMPAAPELGTALRESLGLNAASHRVVVATPLPAPLTDGRRTVSWRVRCVGLGGAGAACDEARWAVAAPGSAAGAAWQAQVVQAAFQPLFARVYYSGLTVAGRDVAAAHVSFTEAAAPSLAATLAAGVRGREGTTYAYVSGDRWSSGVCGSGLFCRTVPLFVGEAGFDVAPGTTCNVRPALQGRVAVEGGSVPMRADRSCFFHALNLTGAAGDVALEFYAATRSGERSAVLRKVVALGEGTRGGSGGSGGAGTAGRIRFLKLRTGIDAQGLGAQARVAQDAPAAVSKALRGSSADVPHVVEMLRVLPHDAPATGPSRRAAAAQTTPFSCTGVTDLELRLKSPPPAGGGGGGGGSTGGDSDDAFAAQYAALLELASDPASELSTYLCGVTEAYADYKAVTVQQAPKLPAGFAPTFRFHPQPSSFACGASRNATCIPDDTLRFALPATTPPPRAARGMCFLGRECQSMYVRFEDTAATLATVRAAYPDEVRHPVVMEVKVDSVSYADGGGGVNGSATLAPDSVLLKVGQFVATNGALYRFLPAAADGRGAAASPAVGDWFAIHELVLAQSDALLASGSSDAGLRVELSFAPKVYDTTLDAVVESIPAARRLVAIDARTLLPRFLGTDGRVFTVTPMVAMQVRGASSDLNRRHLTEKLTAFFRSSYGLADHYSVVHYVNPAVDKPSPDTPTPVGGMASVCFVDPGVNGTTAGGGGGGPPGGEQSYYWFVKCDEAAYAAKLTAGGGGAGGSPAACPDPSALLFMFLSHFSKPTSGRLANFCTVGEVRRMLFALEGTPGVPAPGGGGGGGGNSHALWLALMLLATMCCLVSAMVALRGRQQHSDRLKDLRDLESQTTGVRGGGPQNPIETMQPRGGEVDGAPVPGGMGDGRSPSPFIHTGIPVTGFVPPPPLSQHPEAGGTGGVGGDEARATSEEASAEVQRLRRDIDALENQRGAIDRYRAQQGEAEGGAAGSAGNREEEGDLEVGPAGATPSQLAPLPPMREFKDNGRVEIE
eukprot:Rhum_TRINITY_DN14887_c11_g1::Rhum_TRINITY_DN14887_c11_g1_i1::g.125941::m.125941